MIGNKKYGDFGIRQMVKNVIGYGLALSGLAFAIYYFLWPLMLKIKRGWIISFDIIPYLTNLKIVFNPLFVDLPKVLIFGTLFLTSIFFFYQAHKNAKEKFNSFGYLPIVPDFAFYYLLKGTILLV